MDVEPQRRSSAVLSKHSTRPIRIIDFFTASVRDRWTLEAARQFLETRIHILRVLGQRGQGQRAHQRAHATILDCFHLLTSVGSLRSGWRWKRRFCWFALAGYLRFKASAIQARGSLVSFASPHTTKLRRQSPRRLLLAHPLVRHGLAPGPCKSDPRYLPETGWRIFFVSEATRKLITGRE